METISPVPAGLTDAKVIDLWVQRQRSPLTRSVYQRDIRRLLRTTGLKLPKTSALDLERFAEALAGSGLAPISQGRTLAAVRSLFRFAERIGYCGNPAGGLDLPRTDNPLSERIMTEEDVGALIAHEPDGRNRILLTVLYVAGLRVSEACGLRWRNLQARGEAGQILVHGKGGRTRAVMLPPGRVGPTHRTARCGFRRKKQVSSIKTEDLVLGDQGQPGG
jgi:integrase/recombinase XerD